MSKKAILFDMDGTLVDTVDDLTAALNFTLNTLGLPLKSRQEVQGYLGNGIVAMVELALPENKKGKKEEASQIFKEYYRDHLADYTRPYEGIVELIAHLKQKNYRLAVISNKIQSALDELVHKFFGDSFEFIIGQRNDLKQKPAPDSVHLALKLMDIDKEDTFYVGDSDIDLLTANNSGVECISCSWGFKTKKQLIDFGASQIIDKPLELLKYLS